MMQLELNRPALKGATSAIDKKATSSESTKLGKANP